MASEQSDYIEQLRLLQERYPQESPEKLQRFLQRHGGDVDQVRARLFQAHHRTQRLESLEARFGSALTALLQEYLSAELPKRACLLKLMERFGGDVKYVQAFLQANQAQQNSQNPEAPASGRQRREVLQTRYVTQLAELTAAGINVNDPCVLTQLDKHHGDAFKVMEVMTRRHVKKDELLQLSTKYTSEIAQLEADGVRVKNKRLLMQVLEKADGQVDVAKQLLAERQEQKQQMNSTNTNDSTVSISKEPYETTEDDLDNIRQLRSAGIHGNPRKILATFHQCNQSIELTRARLEKDRAKRTQQSDRRVEQRSQLAQIHDVYLTFNCRADWPDDIERVYFDGNNMMFVVDSLRRLCLNQARKKTERAIAQLAAAWNEQIRIPHVELIFDATQQLEPVGTVQVSSAQPTYKTTDDMLIDIARRSENLHANHRTIVVTSDRELAVHLNQQGFRLVKSYMWFAHCAMILAPDLIVHEPTTSVTNKTRCNLDELVRRIAQID